MAMLIIYCRAAHVIRNLRKTFIACMVYFLFLRIEVLVKVSIEFVIILLTLSVLLSREFKTISVSKKN